MTWAMWARQVVAAAVLVGLWWLASARACRLVNDDKLFEPLRVAWERRLTTRAKLALAEHESAPPNTAAARAAWRRFAYAEASRYFWSCVWCAGFWVYVCSTPVLLVGWVNPLDSYLLPGVWVPWWYVVLLAPWAGNWLYAVIARRADPEDIPDH